DGRRLCHEREAARQGAPDPAARDRGAARGDRAGTNGKRRRRQGGDRDAFGTHRRRHRPPAPRRRPRVHPPGRRRMKLGGEAALVEGDLVPGDVEIADGAIAGYGLASANGRGIAVPGFVDLQVNGFAGIDLLDADTESYSRVGDALLETGVTAYMPTFITAE